MGYKKSRARIEFEEGTKSLKSTARQVSFKSSMLTYTKPKIYSIIHL